MDTPPQKRLCGLDPDVSIVVGEGESSRTYLCYKLQLCHMSSVFGMLLDYAHTDENGIDRISFPELTPDDWEYLYDFIVPPRDPTQTPTIHHDNVFRLLPLFNFFMMKHHVRVSDECISSMITDNSTGNKMLDPDQINIDFWGNIDDEERKSAFSIIINSFEHSSKYGLEKSIALSSQAVSGLLQHVEYTADLLQPESVAILVESLPPLLEHEGRDSSNVEDDNLDAVREPLNDTLERLKKYLHAEYCKPDCDRDKHLFSLLVHASIQRAAAEKQLWRTKASAMCAMRCAMETFPRDLFCRLPANSTEPFGT